tara:strand:+ start:630 stop:1013 length:384 start_codon:yes stop_codon:yes gene_type:complete
MSEAQRLTVYYDGGCPLCRREIGFYRRQPGADGVDWVNLVEADPRSLGDDLDFDAAMARFHVRRPGGRLASGALGFALLWQQLPRFRALGRIAALPGVVHVLELGYRLVLRARSLWRKPDSACRLPR